MKDLTGVNVVIWEGEKQYYSSIEAYSVNRFLGVRSPRIVLYTKISDFQANYLIENLELKEFQGENFKMYECHLQVKYRTQMNKRLNNKYKS